MSFTAGKIRVLIATTNGPVEVQLLTEEDAAIGRCVACIGGTTETADIASAYHAFVVRPTGIIEGRFGHSCYRLDVSGRIDAGSSWQLGVLAAHALLAAGRLAQENDTADAILWATGSVRPVDLTVGSVSHVPEKLENSLARLTQERGAGRPVLLAVPAANASDASLTATAPLRKLGVQFVTVAHAQGLFDWLGMKLPAIGSKGAAAAPAAAAPEPAAISKPARPAKPQQGILAWATAAAAVIVIVLVGAVVFADFPFSVMPRTGSPPRTANTPPPAKLASQTDSQRAEPKGPELDPEKTPFIVNPNPSAALPPPAAAIAPSPPPKLAPPSAPAPATLPTAELAGQPDRRMPEPRGPQLDPGKIPFIPVGERERIRNEYLTASDYKAVAMTMFDSHFVSGLPSQEAADKAAMDACETNKGRRTPNDASLEYRCELYASGTVVVSRRTSIPMPPMPWTDNSVQKPFDASQIPMASQDAKSTAERTYARHARPKALVIGPNGHYFSTSGASAPDEAMRRPLERCGFISKAPCLVVAVDDNFVNAIPTLAKAVGFYQPDALVSVQPEERSDIARRLATSSGGWQAVALGASQHAGVEVGAGSERAAIDGALENCAAHDHDCRIAVIGPWLVEPPPASATSPAATATAAPPAPAVPPVTAPAPSPPPVAYSPPARAAPPAVTTAPVAPPAKTTNTPTATTTPSGVRRVPQTELER